jgi:heavy metal sensor kinase
MSSETSKLHRLGLRASLTLWTTLVLAASLAAGFAWVHYGLWAVMEAKNDASLARKGEELADLVGEAQTGGRAVLEAEIRREVAAYRGEGLVVVVRRPSAVLVAPTSEREQQLAERMASVSVGIPAQTISLPSTGERHRVMRFSLAPPWEHGSSLDLAVSLTESESTLAQFDRRVAAGGLVFLGLAVAGGMILSRQALRPVAQSIRTAKRLNPSKLSERLPRTGAGDELDGLAATINDLLDRLAAYHAQIIRFTADASHELRSPLGAMRAAVEIALGQPREPSEYRKVLWSLGEQCERLTVLVNGLLLLARADAGEVDLLREPLDLACLASEVAEMYEPVAAEHGVRLRWEFRGPIPVLGDASRLRQLLTNLVDNAVKFSEPGGSVTLRIEVADDQVRIVVADTGVGIASEHLPHIFERFYQADPARSSAGSGLGLSICRWIAEAHGGQLEVKSAPGSGSTFTVVLPSPSLGKPVIEPATVVWNP